MRIGVVSSYMLPHTGGLEIVAEQLFERYRAAGHAVRWLSSRIPLDAPAAQDGRVRVRALDTAYERFGLPLPLWGPDGIRELRALIRWADVLQVHGPLYPTSLAALTLARVAGTPTVLLQHIQPSVYSSRALQVIHRAAWRTVGAASLALADRIVAVNPPAERYLRSIDARFTTILNGTDTDLFSPVDAVGRAAARAELELPADGPLLLFVGRLVERKGLEVLLDLLPRLGGWRALIVGDGPRRAAIPSHPALTWIPHIPPSQMPLAYQAANALLFPARGEGLPLVVQEGMSAGLPVLARTDEVFAGPLHAAGLIVPIHDAPSAAAGLASLTPERRAILGAAGRSWALAGWGWDAAVTAHLAALADAAGPPRA